MNFGVNWVDGVYTSREKAYGKRIQKGSVKVRVQAIFRILFFLESRFSGRFASNFQKFRKKIGNLMSKIRNFNTF